jgi:threonine dehydrogenase-like Zn-dependent dehydrogenase
MRSSWLNGPSDITVVDVEAPQILDPRDVIVDVTFATICGSDLWAYRGLIPRPPGSTGHEFIGRVREVGSAITTLSPGDSVIAPFMYSEGSCYECTHGLQSFCAEGGLWGKGGNGGNGAHAERIRVPFADATLVALPWHSDEIDSSLARKILPLTDVYATGTHGAFLAGVTSGDTVAVVGDGAVGISAASAALRLGAARVVLIGEQDARLAVAKNFGVETLKVSRDEPSVERFLEVNGGALADRVIECVGMQAAFDTALDLVRVGGSMGFVGVPHGVESVSPKKIFDKGMRIAGGTAPARKYLPGLIADVEQGRLDPSALIDQVYGLSDIATGFEAMHTGAALKVLLDISA